MTGWPAPDHASMCAFYGNPDANSDGFPDRKWEDANLVSVAPPYRMVLAWDVAKPVKSIRIHRKCADSLMRVLTGIRDHYGTQSAIEAARMHLYGGGYNFRMKRGGTTLSNHSWGSAIDLDPERNAFKRMYGAVEGMMPEAVVDLFAAEGWGWGGRWSTPDGMHFEAVTR